METFLVETVHLTVLERKAETLDKFEKFLEVMRQAFVDDPPDDGDEYTEGLMVLANFIHEHFGHLVGGVDCDCIAGGKEK